MKFFILLLALCSVAHGARQIVIGASPPPPAISSSAPGTILGVVVPGFSSATFGTAQRTLLCDGIRNLTSGYPKQFISCDVGYVGDVDNGQSGVPAVGVNGFVIFQGFSGMSASDQAQASQSRTAFTNNVLNNNTIFSAIFAGANTNNTCTSEFNTGSTGAAAASSTSNDGFVVNGVNPQARCRIASKGFSTVETTGNIKFNSGGSNNVPATTIDTVGIDNGKTCPFGSAFVTPATPALAQPLTDNANAANELNILACQLSASNKVDFTCSFAQKVDVSAASASISSGKLPAGLAYVSQGAVIQLSGSAMTGAQTLTAKTSATYTAGWYTGSNAAQIAQALAATATAGTCSDADLTALVTALSAAPVTVTGPATATAGNQAAQVTFSVTLPTAVSGCTLGDTMYYAGSGTAAAGAVAATVVGVTGQWSPRCDTDFNFYQTNRVGQATNPAAIGPTCPSCINAASTPSLFAYNGANAGKFCTSTSGTSMVSGNVKSVNAAGLAGSSCVGPIGVTNGGTTAPQDTGKAQLATGVLPAAGVSMTQVFPQTPTGVFSPSNTPLAYSATTFRYVAVDTEYLSPCSFPALTYNLGGVTPVGTAGNYELKTTSAASGTCNTYSLFWNGGTATNGIGVFPVQNALALSAEFSAPIITPSPAPAPAPTPSPSPVPVPSPAKPPSPAMPPSPTPLVCTYTGLYNLRPLYAPCSNYNIASGTSSDCSNNFVNLRTRNQLGGKPARAVWKFATIAQDNISTPTNVLATARTSCTNRFLAAPSDPSQGLKVGGSSWRWQFVPFPGSSRCDEVNIISQNRLSTTAFLQVPRTCDRFRYNATDGGRQRFRLTKV